MDGDTVRIRIVRSGKDGKIERAVEEIVLRARREFSGTYQLVDGKSLVWLDGANLEHPIEVGDVRGLPLNNQNKVIVELVRFPDSFHAGEGVILKVLGSSKNPAVDTMAVMHQFGLQRLIRTMHWKLRGSKRICSTMKLCRQGERICERFRR